MLLAVFFASHKRRRHSRDTSGVQSGPEPDNVVQMAVEMQEEDRAWDETIHPTQQLTVLLGQLAKLIVLQAMAGIWVPERVCGDTMGSMLVGRYLEEVGDVSQGHG